MAAVACPEAASRAPGRGAWPGASGNSGDWQAQRFRQSCRVGRSWRRQSCGGRESWPGESVGLRCGGAAIRVPVRPLATSARGRIRACVAATHGRNGGSVAKNYRSSSIVRTRSAAREPWVWPVGRVSLRVFGGYYDRSTTHAVTEVLIVIHRMPTATHRRASEPVPIRLRRTILRRATRVRRLRARPILRTDKIREFDWRRGQPGQHRRPASDRMDRGTVRRRHLDWHRWGQFTPTSQPPGFGGGTSKVK